MQQLGNHSAFEICFFFPRYQRQRNVIIKSIKETVIQLSMFFLCVNTPLTVIVIVCWRNKWNSVWEIRMILGNSSEFLGLCVLSQPFLGTRLYLHYLIFSNQTFLLILKPILAQITQMIIILNNNVQFYHEHFRFWVIFESIYCKANIR